MRDRRPLPLQLRDSLLAELRSDGVEEGGLVPTESELARRHGVSRTTVREALKLLEGDGVITVRHGKGRYVSSPLSIEGSLSEVEGVTELTTRLGLEVDVRVLSVETRIADEPEAEALRLKAGERVIALERLWLGAGEALIYSVDTFPARLIRQPISDIDWSSSLLGILESEGIRVASAVAAIKAVNLPPETARGLVVSPHLPWILMRHTAAVADASPVLFSHDYYRGDRFTFYARRRRASRGSDSGTD
jgi:GntR family transcriptional regulator